ncbi:MAG: FHA domain-containing protein [Actinomycetota bacterium]
MPDLVLDLLKYVFLAVLYLFIARAVRAVYLEIRPPASRAASGPERGSTRRGKPPRHAAVVEGDARDGKVFELGSELIIGRADKCHVVLDDTYVSQLHARIFSRGEAYLVEDLGSTNGTYLNRRRVSSPTEVHRGDRVKVGKTVLEMRR